MSRKLSFIQRFDSFKILMKNEGFWKMGGGWFVCSEAKELLLRCL